MRSGKLVGLASISNMSNGDVDSVEAIRKGNDYLEISAVYSTSNHIKEGSDSRQGNPRGPSGRNLSQSKQYY